MTTHEIAHRDVIVADILSYPPEQRGAAMTLLLARHRRNTERDYPDMTPAELTQCVQELRDRILRRIYLIQSLGFLSRGAR